MALFDFLKEKRAETGRTLEEVPVWAILPNPNQPRKTFDEESIAELARSIAQVGLIQPLVVRKKGERYELVSGERRLRAVRSLGKPCVSCIVEEDITGEDSALMAVIENLQREDLDYFEESECYKALLETLNITQEELAERIGKSQSFVANKLRLLRLEPEVREAIRHYGLSERHARAVLKLASKRDRLDVIVRAGEGLLSVSETERSVEKLLNEMFDSRRAGARPRPVIMRIVKDYRLFMNTVNIACDQLRSGGARVEVEQLDREDGVDICIRVTKPEVRRAIN